MKEAVLTFPLLSREDRFLEEKFVVVKPTTTDDGAYQAVLPPKLSPIDADSTVARGEIYRSIHRG